jgi:U3 small nucleolar RNA-associated protein 11
MPGASLRNAMKRRTHKERAQPAKRRKRFGLLEKHKDYVERAKNYRQKRGRLRVLKEKAASRNPDEFYFGMVHGKTNKGVYDAGTQAGNGDDHKVSWFLFLAVVVLSRC